MRKKAPKPKEEPFPMPKRRKPRTILDPDWLKSPAGKEAIEAFKDTLLMGGWGGANSFQLYFPEEYDKAIPETGAWVRISHRIPTRIKPPLFSMWFAMPASRGGGVTGGHYTPPRQYARIHTPQGDLWIEPFEYVKVGDIKEWLGMEPHMNVHWLNAEAAPSTETLFYIMSRGISRKEAILWLAQELASQDVFYVTSHPEYVAAYYYLEEGEYEMLTAFHAVGMPPLKEDEDEVEIVTPEPEDPYGLLGYGREKEQEITLENE